jgi:hypothetical protein
LISFLGYLVVSIFLDQIFHQLDGLFEKFAIFDCLEQNLNVLVGRYVQWVDGDCPLEAQNGITVAFVKA